MKGRRISRRRSASASPSSATADERPDQQRPDRPAERRVGRVGALREDQRPEPAPQERPDREAAEGQRADDQPLPVPPQTRGRW